MLGLLGAGALWFAESRGVTPTDLAEIAQPPPPEPCSEPDPTGEGCLTPSMRALHDAVVARFGGDLRGVSCWSEHAWNPSSDHPAGRACDFFPTRSGRFPVGDELATGWATATWLRENAAELRVRYVVWQGRIWVRGSADQDGWGRPYDGGGVYDPADATGGHYDHVHVSVRA